MEEKDYQSPSTPTEQRLAAAWAKVLGIPEQQIGRRDNLFDRGATSLSAVRLAVALREYLVEVYGADGLPFNTYFCNGDPIGVNILHVINEVYEANIAREPLQAGDLMLVDNIIFVPPIAGNPTRDHAKYSSR